MVLIDYYHSKVFELCHIFKGFIASCYLAHKHFLAHYYSVVTLADYFCYCHTFILRYLTS